MLLDREWFSLLQPMQLLRIDGENYQPGLFAANEGRVNQHWSWITLAVEVQI